VILRRGGWREPNELHEALGRASAESEQLSVTPLRSYVLAELDGSLGTVCVYGAPSPEVVRLHAYRAGLPVDEIVAVADTVVGDDATPAGSGRRSARETQGEGGSG
jgi:Nickel responsive protein SCO4226-like